MEQSNESCQRHASALRTKHLRTMEAMHSMGSKLSELREENEALRAAAAKSSDNTSLVEEFQEKLQLQKNSIIALEATIKSIDAEKKGVEEQLAAECAKGNEQLSTVSTLEAELVQVKAELATALEPAKGNPEAEALEVKLREKNIEIQDRNVMLLQLTRQRDDSRNLLQTQTKDFNTLKEEKLIVDARFNEYVKEKELAIHDLDQEVVRLKSVVANYRLQTVSFDENKQKLANFKNEYRKMQESVKNIKQELRTSRANAKSEEKIISRLTRDAEYKESQLLSVNSELQSVKERLQEEINYRSQIEQQLVESQHALEELLEKAKRPKNGNFGKYVDLKTENQKLQDQLSKVSQAGKVRRLRKPSRPLESSSSSKFLSSANQKE